MSSASDFQTQVDKASVNMDRLDGIVNGDASAVIGTDNGPVPSIAKLQADFNLSAGSVLDDATTQATAAALSAATAEAAAGPNYANTAAGLAATSNGQSFAVVNGDGTVTIYRNTSGTAVYQRRLATTDALASSATGQGLDMVGRSTVAALLASTTPARGAGALWHADDFIYVEAASGSADYHLVTAGGVKLYVSPGPRGYDARAFGAKDDWNGTTGTNNFTPFEIIASLRPLTVVMSKSRTGTGVYMTNGTSAVTDATGMLLDGDPGVSLWVAAGTPFTFAKGIASKRDFRINYATLRQQDTIGPIQGKRMTELGRPGSALDGELQVPDALDFADATHWELTWPNGVFTTAVPSAVSTDAVIWGAVPSSKFRASVFHVVPGDYIVANPANRTDYFPGIAVMTDSGWALVWQNQSSSQTVLNFGEKVGGANAVETSASDLTIAQKTYRFAASMLGIKIFDQRSFGLVVNGIVIKRYRTTGNIQRAGWVGGYGPSSNITFAYPVMFKNKRTLGVKPLRILYPGDSTSSASVTQQSQSDYMRQLIGGIGGAQVQLMTCIAVPGHTSANQLAVLQGIDLDGAGYDYMPLPIGINDIQDAVPEATFLANVEAMIDRARQYSIEPIVTLPAMFYSEADAQAFGQDGVDTSRSDQGSGHRLALMRLLASKQVYCNLASFEDMGAVTALLLQMKADGEIGDQVLAENIHPTSWGAMVQGYGAAKAVVAHMNHAQQHDFPAGSQQAIRFPATYFSGGVGATAVPEYTVDGRNLNILAALSTNAVSLPDGTVVGTLPKRLCPRENIVAPLVNLSGANQPITGSDLGYWHIGITGTVKVYGVDPAAVFIGITANWKI